MQKTMLFVAVGLYICSFAAADVYWSNSSGSGDGFYWQNGFSSNNLFGNPTLIGGDTLTFFPSTFRAEDTASTADSVYDVLSFDFYLADGYTLDSILLNQYGDYGIVDSGAVSTTSQAYITNIDTLETISATFTANPSTEITEGSGKWQSIGLIEFIPSSWQNFNFFLQTDLTAFANESSAAFIENKVSGITINSRAIPEPMTVVILTSGLFFAGLSGKKHRKNAFFITKKLK